MISLILLILFPITGGEEHAIAYFSMNGVKGQIAFYQVNTSAVVQISVNLTATGTFKWEIHKFPVSYSSRSTCDEVNIGPVYEANGDLSARLGQLLANGEVKNFTDDKLKLRGESGILGRSFLLQGIDSNIKLCTTITSPFPIYSAVAKLVTPVAGTIIFRQIEGEGEATIYTDLYYVNGKSQTGINTWRIFVATNLDNVGHKSLIEICKYLNLLYDPDEVNDAECSPTNHKKCKMGDLTKKHGSVNVGSKKGSAKMFFTDTNLPLSGIGIGYSLYVIVDLTNGGKSCGEIKTIMSKSAFANFSQDSLKGFVNFEQKSPFDPTYVTMSYYSPTHIVNGVYVHQFPILPRLKKEEKPCSPFSIGLLWNPLNINQQTAVSSGVITEDLFAIGNLSGRHGNLSSNGSYFINFMDYNLPLFGPNSIMGRSLVLHTQGDHWICSNINNARLLITARVIFYTPVVGYVYLRQERDDHNSETSIYMDLSYSDGSVYSMGHEWQIHIKQIGDDFYKWQNRCLTVENSHNPYNVDVSGDYKIECNPENPLRCKFGDLSGRHGKIDMYSSKRVNISKHFFIDSEISLSGPMSIIGRSFVIYYNGTDTRRLACGNINELHPIKIVAKEWTSIQIKGQAKFEQSTLFDLTKSSVDISNLNYTAGGYHIHELSVPLDLEKPCSKNGVMEHFNPFEIDPKESPPPTVGTDDAYELGDLSGKYGRMTDKDTLKEEFYDSILPIQGPNSIIGRSFVIHKEVENERWVCCNVEYDARAYVNASVIYARAIFEDIFLSGYIAMSQLAFGDGTYSDTTIEVNLTHAGNLTNVTTYGHRWHMLVQAIGRDNLLENSNYRCLSGGGINNRFYTKVDQDYDKECSIYDPLRCQIGDISGRLGLLTIGDKQRKIYTDVHLPLTGNFSVLGAAILIYEQNKETTKLACANLEPESQVVGIFRVQKGKKFTGKVFQKYALRALESEDWMVIVETVKTRELYNGLCAEVIVHFKGPKAYEMKEKLRRMLKTRDKKIGFRECTTQLINKLTSHSPVSSLSTFLWLISLMVLLTHYTTVL